MIHQFDSFKEALDYLIDLEAARSAGVFTVTYIKVADAVQHIIAHHLDETTATLPLTRALAAALVDPANMEAVSVGSEAHYGYILVSSAHEGDPVSVFAIE